MPFARGQKAEATVKNEKVPWWMIINYVEYNLLPEPFQLNMPSLNQCSKYVF